ncbi:hypothetical protein FRC07_011439 [Ceratobasidium sp. 392]|nr:hypothetical protein FRC07_011439 [Ceratobasidium sp. 392]
MRFATVASAAAVLVGAAAPAAAFDFSAYGNPKCHMGEFYWAQKGGMCLPVGGGYGGSPPYGIQCPSLWYWHQNGFCAPRYTPPYSQPTCPGNTIWDGSSYSCKPPATPPPSGNNCPPNHFWWKNRSCCLPHGGPPSQPLPPRGHWCPSYWYWDPKQNSCVPAHPDPPSPSCPPGTSWNPYVQCCDPNAPQPPPPTPSLKPRAPGEKRAHNAVPHHKKKAKRTQVELSFCEVGWEKCPIKGVFGNDMECVDTASDLHSCGGCTSIGQGQNCLTIPNAKVSTCSQGACEVLSCDKGYTIGSDKKSCVALL